MLPYALGFLFGSFMVILFNGCNGFDATLLMNHPDTTIVSSTFDVALVNAYMYFDSSSTILKDVERDSLHMFVGLPETWDIVSASIVVIRDWDTFKIDEFNIDSINRHYLAESTLTYLPQPTPLLSDTSRPSALSGKTITGYNRRGEGITINADEIEVWKSYSAPVNILLEKDHAHDIVFPFDSTLTFALNTGLIPDSIASTIEMLSKSGFFTIPEKIGISVRPIILFLNIQTGSQPCTDTLYYFTKTGSMNPKTSSMVTLLSSFVPEIATIEKGGMTYTPITAISPVGVNSIRSNTVTSKITIITGHSMNPMHINLGNTNRYNALINIYSLKGNLIRTLTTTELSNSIIWNGNDTKGKRVGSGSYIIRITDNSIR